MQSTTLGKATQLIPFLALFLLHSTGLDAQQKNVLVIMADDFNHWIEPIGYYPDAHTPNINALASRGVLFADASASSSVCLPSRNALWSGIHPITSGIDGNQGGFIRDHQRFTNVRTMNQHFTDNGYFTYGAGKLYHPGRMGTPGTDPEHWSALSTQGTGSAGGPFYSWASMENDLYKWSAGEFDIENAGDRKVTRDVAERISNYDREAPFFMAVGLFRPHLPWNAHKRFFDMFNPDSIAIPQGVLENDADDIQGNYNGRDRYEEIAAAGEYKNSIRAYLANMAFADENVGILMDALNNSDFADNTIVVFMGDHGWHLGEKVRMSKHADFDHAYRTTLIIYDPDQNGNGDISRKVVSLQDVYPTLISLTNLPNCASVQGNDLSPLLTSPNQADWDAPIFMQWSNNRVIKTNRWRLIDNGVNSQLYDVENDPWEFDNLYNLPGYQNVVSSMRNQIADFVSSGEQLEAGMCTTTATDETAPIGKGKTFRAWPNPANTELHLSGLRPGVELFAYGNEGKRIAVDSAHRPVDISGWPAGVYTLRAGRGRVVRVVKR